MKRSLIIGLLLAGCSQTPPPAVEFPDVPKLSAETRRECPPADLVTGSLGDLASKDAALAIEYAKCQQRHMTAIGAWDTMDALMKAAQKKAESQK